LLQSSENQSVFSFKHYEMPEELAAEGKKGVADNEINDA
jgi:hypothetical protein